MNSYDQWIDVMVATKAATGGSEEGFALFDEWSAQAPNYNPEVTRQKWDSFRPPYRKGWGWLAQKAAEASGGAFSAADEDFAPMDDQEALALGENEAQLHDSTGNMFDRYAWIEGAQRAVHLESGALLNQEQFEFRVLPTEKGVSAWKIFKDASTHTRRSFVNLTFRPGAGRIVEEDLPDLQGPCFNVWRAPPLRRPLPDKATARDIAPFLELAAHVVPLEAEREHILNWMAFTAQFPGQKIHHAIVLGSRIEGIGKDTLLEPLRRAVGRAYTREIGPQHLAAPFNAWLMGAKLVVVQEMHNFERKETMNRLKPLVAAPPDALPVNMKHRQEFFVPNIVSTVFFTNEDDAMALSKGDRRYFVTWNDGEPLPQERYDAIWAWLEAGGSEKVIRWMLSRDLRGFDAKGRAPMTEAKAEMRRMSRTPLQEWVEEGVEEDSGVWGRDLVLCEEIAALVPEHVRFKGQPVSGQKLARALRAVGAECVTEKLRLDGMEGSKRIWALRRGAIYRDLSPVELRELFAKQKAEGDARDRRGVDAAFR